MEFTTLEGTTISVNPIVTTMELSSDKPFYKIHDEDRHPQNFPEVIQRAISIVAGDPPFIPWHCKPWILQYLHRIDQLYQEAIAETTHPNPNQDRYAVEFWCFKEKFEAELYRIGWHAATRLLQALDTINDLSTSSCSLKGNYLNSLFSSSIEFSMPPLGSISGFTFDKRFKTNMSKNLYSGRLARVKIPNGDLLRLTIDNESVEYNSGKEFVIKILRYYKSREHWSDAAHRLTPFSNNGLFERIEGLDVNIFSMIVNPHNFTPKSAMDLMTTIFIPNCQIPFHWITSEKVENSYDYELQFNYERAAQEYRKLLIKYRGAGF